jgi:hypothetical protein
MLNESRLLNASIADTARAVVFGIAVALSLSTLILVAKTTKVSPLPAPLGVAFTHWLFGSHLSERSLLPVGLALHVGWVTSATVAYVVLFRRRLTLVNALLVAATMWLVANLVFVPLIGWGVFASAQGGKVIATIALTHLVYALFVWVICRSGMDAHPNPVRSHRAAEPVRV